MSLCELRESVDNGLDPNALGVLQWPTSERSKSRPENHCQVNIFRGPRDTLRQTDGGFIDDGEDQAVCDFFPADSTAGC